MVPGLVRGLSVLALFSRRRPAQTLGDMAHAVGLSRSAVYRLAYTLEKEGYLSRDANSRQYRLTSKVLSLGFEYLHSRSIVEIAEPTLRTLSEEASAAAYIVVLDGAHAVYLARALPSAGLISNLQVGARLPAHATASGRILLAHKSAEGLAKIYRQLSAESTLVPPPKSLRDLQTVAEHDRRRGYVFHRSLINPGVVSLACVVRGKNAAPVAAITLIGPEQFVAALGGERAVQRMVAKAAGAISEKLGHRTRD
jgi:IclR family pca regulon transcriptional regulator